MVPVPLADLVLITLRDLRAVAVLVAFLVLAVLVLVATDLVLVLVDRRVLVVADLVLPVLRVLLRRRILLRERSPAEGGRPSQRSDEKVLPNLLGHNPPEWGMPAQGTPDVWISCRC